MPGEREGSAVSLGLPTHLSRSANSRGFATAARWAGLACLAAAVIDVAFSNASMRTPAAWATLVLLVPMVALVLLLAKGRSAALTGAYLAIGAVWAFCYVVALLSATAAYRDTNLFVVSLPVVALTLVGGTGTGSLVGILWASAGFASAEGAVLLAATITGRVYRPEAVSLGAYLFLVVLLIFEALRRGTRARPQAIIHRAVRDARLVELRREVVASRAADLHDTVLSELMAVAGTEPGPLPDRLRDRIDADLRSLGAVVADAEPGADPGVGGAPADPWLGSELFATIEAARDEGLSVSVSGDRDALARLAEPARREVAHAVRQCLANVLRHSGSVEAEVAISASADSLSVMVVDAGSGFAPAAAGPDRLGLRRSVQERIARIGGTVSIYSSAGVGTTVIMVVPIHAGPLHAGERG